MNKATEMKRDFSIFTGLLKTARQGDPTAPELVLTGVASSTIKDRHGDTMTQNALQSMLRTAEGMTIYLNHEYRVPEDVAGTVRQAWITQAGEDLHDLHLEIVMNQSNKRAVEAFDAIDKGVKLGLSIGAMIPDGGAKRDKKSGTFVIDEVELLETSIVSIPANPRSWVDYARKSLLSKEVPEAEPAEEPAEDPADEEPAEITAAADVPDLSPGLLTSTTSTDIYLDTDTTEPDVTGSKVTVWPSGKVSVETPEPANPAAAPSQEAVEAEPGTEETDALAATLGELARDATPEVRDLLEPTVMASLQTSRLAMGALVDVVTKAVERANEAERQRDEALLALKNLGAVTEAFITRVAAHPRGRRALQLETPMATRAIEQIRASGIYADEFLDILTKGA